MNARDLSHEDKEQMIQEQLNRHMVNSVKHMVNSINSLANAGTRAGKFLHNLVMKQQKISLDVHGTGNDSKSVANGRFARHLKVVIPAILASAATYAFTSAPKVEMKVQNEPPVTLASMEQTFGNVFASVGETEESDFWKEDRERQFQQKRTIAKCMYDNVLMKEANNDEFEPGVLLMLSLAGASDKINDEIESWVAQTNADPDEAVAALCENPEDWEGQLKKWKSVQKNQDNNAWMELVTQRAYADFGGRAKAVYKVAEDVVHVRDMYGAQAIKTSDISNQKWIDAASSIANGMSSFFGRDTQNAIRDATSAARQGGYRLRQGENITNRNDMYDKIRSIGDLMGGIGNDIQNINRRQQAEEQRRVREYENEMRRHEQEMRRLEQQSGQRYRYR